MTIAQYTIGVAFLSATLVPLAVGASRIVSRALPLAPRTLRAVHATVLTLAVLVVAAELLGSVGLFTRAALAVTCAVIGVVSIVAAGRLPPVAHDGEALAPSGGAVVGRRWTLVAAALAAIFVLFEWGTYSAERLAGGMIGFDSLWYHMPFAAEFASTGSTVDPAFIQIDPTQTYYPATAELLHAVAIAAFGGWDFLTVFLNLAAAALALLAGWCIGQARGVAPLSMMGVAIVLILPAMVATQPGEAQNDVVGLAFMLAAVAILMSGGKSAIGVVAGSAALGLAASTKLSLVIPSLLVLVAILVMTADPARRRRLWGLALGTAAVTGSFWYVRNLAITGNPLPWVGIHVGPLELAKVPMPNDDKVSFSLAHYLTDTHIIRSALLPQVHVALGDLWPLLLATTAAGAVLALVERDKRMRLAGAISIGAAIAYVVTPGSAAGVEGTPNLFALNLRYATPALAIGLAVLPATRLFLGGRRRIVLAAWFLALLPASLATIGIWPTLLYYPAARRWWGFALAAGVVAGSVLVARSRSSRRHAAVATVLLSAAVLAVGWPASQTFERHRYARSTGTVGVGLAAVWARNVSHSRIATSNVLVYPLYGRRISNDVDNLGERGPHGSFRPFRTCREWRQALNAGHYRYVVIVTRRRQSGTRTVSLPGPDRWTRSARGVRVVLRDGGSAVYRVERPLDAGSCPA
jgi:hypothetical protein